MGDLSFHGEELPSASEWDLNLSYSMILWLQAH